MDGAFDRKRKKDKCWCPSFAISAAVHQESVFPDQIGRSAEKRMDKCLPALSWCSTRYMQLSGYTFLNARGQQPVAQGPDQPTAQSHPLCWELGSWFLSRASHPICCMLDREWSMTNWAAASPSKPNYVPLLLFILISSRRKSHNPFSPCRIAFSSGSLLVSLLHPFF